MLSGLGNALVDHLEAACPARPLPLVDHLQAASAARACAKDSPKAQPVPALQPATRVASLDLDLQGDPDLEGADALLELAGASSGTNTQARACNERNCWKLQMPRFTTLLAWCSGPGDQAKGSADATQEVRPTLLVATAVPWVPLLFSSIVSV